MKVDGAVGLFEESLLEGFHKRMRDIISARSAEYKRQVCEQIDRAADEELASLILTINRWARISVGDQTLTIELRKPGIVREESAQP